MLIITENMYIFSGLYLGVHQNKQQYALNIVHLMHPSVNKKIEDVKTYIAGHILQNTNKI